MFGFGKRTKDLEERVQQLEETTREAERRMDMQADVHQGAKELADGVQEQLSHLEKNINRHDMAIEDLLDSLESWQDSLQSSAEQLRSVLEAQSSGEAEAFQKRETCLLDLYLSLLDQFLTLHRAAKLSGDENWIRQFSLAAEAESEKQLLSGLEVIQETGVPFSYFLHEAVSVLPAASPEQHMRVADILSCGLVSRGQVHRKARVSVYQYISPDMKEDKHS